MKRDVSDGQFLLPWVGRIILENYTLPTSSTYKRARCLTIRITVRDAHLTLHACGMLRMLACGIVLRITAVCTRLAQGGANSLPGSGLTDPL